MIDVPDGHLYLGEAVDAAGERTGAPVLLDAADLTTHGVIVGMTGSGKTGLGVALIEEALLQGIPCLALDPKGDLGNLALTFPDLSPESFAPWVEGGDPAEVAATWRDGLASWGIGPERVQALRDAAPVTIYTPGSTSGVGLNIVGGLRRPPDGTDAETVADEVEGFASGLLGLVGIAADPLASREHILLANLVQQAWSSGRDLDLPTLVAQVQDPPLRKLGVFELDEFFPPADRKQLALRLNGLLASPAFAAWGAGADLDVDGLLRPGGRPSCAVVSLAHLSDEERQFVVTLVLGKLVTWMRRQPGTDRLRVLVYFDEVAGYAPPSAVPPAKGPILTLLKQARAFGVGLVLATQNPVDLDYKALSNAGTWVIGRLQTEQDQARLLDGLAGAGDGVDRAALGATIGGLAKRRFVLRQAGRDGTTTFTSRWAMSYLRGPLTREQISTLTAMAAANASAPAVVTDPAAAGAATDPTTVGAGPSIGAAADPTTAGIATDPTTAGTAADVSVGDTTTPSAAAPTAPGAATPMAPGPAVAPEVDADTLPIAPRVAKGTRSWWLDPAAPWAAEVGAEPTGTRFAAGVVARVELTYDETKADLRHTEEYECVLFPLDARPDVAGVVAVDHDPRDLRAEPPPGATYVVPDAPIGDAALFTGLQRDLVAHLVANQVLTIQVNRELKLFSRPGETEADFATRCEAAADDRADAATVALTKRYAARIERARDALATAQDRVAQSNAAVTTRRTDELVRGAGDVLGSILGGRSRARKIARGIGSAATRRSRTSEATRRVQTAQNRASEKAEALADLEADLADELADLVAEWDAKAAAVEPLEVPLERTDVRVTQLDVVWIPTG